MAAWPLKTTLHPQGRHVSSEKETAMNLTTITNIPSSSNWKRVTTHSVSAAAGVALAISALAGLSGSLKSSDGGMVSAPSVAPVAAQRFAKQSPLRVVLVDNIEQQERLQSQFAADEYVTGYALQSPPVVAVKGSDLEQSLVGASSAVAANNRHVQVTNLSLPDRIATPASGLSASDADVAASLPSTALANFSNVDPARQGTLAPAFSAEYAQFISLQEHVLVALDSAAFPPERVSTDYAEHISLQEHVLVALSGTAADAEYVAQSLR
jgi:hypothetical protein